MTFKQTLKWLAGRKPGYSFYLAASSHGNYEVRAYSPRVWTCWLNGLPLEKTKFTSHIKAIDSIEQTYYMDQKQITPVVKIVDRRVFGGNRRNKGD